MNNIIAAGLDQIISINEKRNQMAALCLSEKYDNENLWDQYADNGRGFCIEYTFDFINIDKKFKYSCFPILYDKKKALSLIDILKNSLKSIDKTSKLYDEFKKFIVDVLCLLYTKDTTYSGEEEWRFILGDEYSNQDINFPYATSIYLGNDMTKRNEKILINIAKKLKLRVYKRTFDNIDCRWVFELIE